MRRRNFVGLMAGAAVAWPHMAGAQDDSRKRRVGILMPLDAQDKFAKARLDSFTRGLQNSGWVAGRNLEIDIRWGARGRNRVLKEAADMIARRPDVILATGSSTVGPLLQLTRTVPIVFVIVLDPVGAGYVESLARPGGNATGWVQFEYSLSAKWVELLKQIAPRVKRAAIIRDPTITGGIGQFGAIQSAAPQFGLEVTPINVHDPREIERALTRFAAGGDGGLIVTSAPGASARRELLIDLAARLKLPAVYYERFFVEGGGLIALGPDFLDQYARASGYVDRILRGANPADLPVQQPTKFEMAINLKTAKALGLEVSPALLARADEVVE